jgi:hypothetical protein
VSVWKIFYTNGTSLAWDDPSIMGDVTQIPSMKRIGVHSVIQPTDKDTMREAIHKYHYVYLLSANQWVGMFHEAVMDHLVNRFDDIGCILNGRTVTAERFYRLKQTVKMDPDVIGWITPEDELLCRHTSFLEAGSINRHLVLFGPEDGHKYSFRHVHRILGGENWTDPARHRQYPPSISAAPVYGEQKFWQN